MERIESRLERAQGHHDAFNALVSQTFASGAYGVNRETNHDGSKHIYSAVVPEGFVEALSLIISDCLHKLRSALDSLVYGLAELHMAEVGEVLTDHIAKSLAFPICDDEASFVGAQKRMRIALLDVVEVGVVEAHQPYRECDLPEDSPLWSLRELQNIDKHRFLLRLGIQRDGFMTHADSTGHDIRWRLLTKWSEPVKDKTPLIEFTIDPPNAEIDLEYDPHLIVILDDGHVSGEAGERLRVMRSAVRRVVIEMKELP